MKKNRGKFTFYVLLLFLTYAQLFALESPYCTYSISSSKTTAFIHEPISISFQTRQKIHNEVMFFDLKAQESDDYKVISIEEKRHEFNYHDAKKEFQYLVIPKKAGKIVVKFDFRIRRASDDAVAQAYTGSRDNVKSIPTIKVPIATLEVPLNVQALSKEIQAVGSFHFTMKVDKTHTDAYMPINVLYKFSGRGYLDEHFEPINNIDNVSIFRGKKAVQKRASKDGYIYDIEWNYSLVSEQNFTIPAVKLSSYNYWKHKNIVFHTDEKNITITPLVIENLLDDEEAPNSALELEKYIAYVYNFLLFISGFLFAKLIKYIPRKRRKKEECCLSIKNSKGEKALLKAVLSLHKNQELHSEIADLEEMIYNQNSTKNSEEIKKSIIKKIAT